MTHFTRASQGGWTNRDGCQRLKESSIKVPVKVQQAATDRSDQLQARRDAGLHAGRAATPADVTVRRAARMAFGCRCSGLILTATTID